MQYRDLGRTGIKVSALAFGCMRFPKGPDGKSVDREASVALMKRAYELGVNYFDTAYVYNGGESEQAIAEFLKGVPRDRVFVADKNPLGSYWYRVPGDRAPNRVWREHLEEMLRRLDTDYIDVLHFHDVSAASFRMVVRGPDGVLDQALRAKEEGLVRHLGFSSHDSPANVIQMLDAMRDVVEVMVIQYNLLDRKYEPAIERAHDSGIGVAVMGPVGGGRLIHPSDLYGTAVAAGSTPELALRFVLAHPGVSCAMSGMNSMEQLEENARAASLEVPLTREDLERLNELQRENQRLLGLYCTGCAYCMPCPHGVNIPENFAALNLLRVHGMRALAEQSYEGLGEARAAACKECNACLGKCPQHIDIPTRLKEVAEALSR